MRTRAGICGLRICAANNSRKHHANGQPYPEAECSIYRPIRDGVGSHVAGEVLWRADGTSFPAEVWSYPMRRGEEFLGAVVSFFDISDRQQAGAEGADSQGARLPTQSS